MNGLEPQNKQRTVMRPLRFALPLISIALSLTVGFIAFFAVKLTEIDEKYLSESWASALILPLIAAVCLISLVAPFIFKGSNKPTSSPLAVRLFSLFPTGAAIYLLYCSIAHGVGDWDVAFILSALVCIPFFVSKLSDGYRNLKVLSSLGVFALSALVIALLYLDHTIELNSSFKWAVQFGGVGLILGVIADSRAALSRISQGWFVFLKSVSLMLCLLCTGLVFTAFGCGFEVFPHSYLVFTVLYFCYSVSTIAELISVSIRALR
ncbi:MAG: hypothetical protein ACI3X1_04865 [Eubacteriales bacterium]